jgi:hypothetical protein
VLQDAPPAISTCTRRKGHFIAGPNGCKPVAHNALLTLSALSSSMRAYPSHPNDERGHLSHWSQTPRATTPIRTARNSGSPAQPPRAAVRHASVVKHAREKQSERKSAACSERARSLPMGRELEIGQFPLEPNTKSQNTHSGCHKTALLSRHVRPSDTHQALSMSARNRSSARALSVHIVHKLCPWGKSSILDRSHCSGTACGSL